MIQDRAYQNDCIAAIWKEMAVSDDQLVQLPTGSGKTIIFTKLLKLILEKYPDIKASVLVNKIKLVEQTKDKLLYLFGDDKIGLYCGSLGEYDDESMITVGSIQSISMRTQLLNLLIIDEAHNAYDVSTYETYLNRLRVANPKLKIVRFTATPYTMKGYIYGPDLPIKKLTFKRTLNQMISEGNLVAPIFKHVKDSFDTSQLRLKRGEYVMKDVEKMSKDQEKCRRQVADAMARIVGRKKVVWAATCIEHAMILKEEIEVYEKACIVHSKLTDKERARNLNDFENGDARHLISIQIVTEGYDYPPIDVIAIMTPTRSPGKYVQLIGRGLRPVYSPGYDLSTQANRLKAIADSDKKDCLILDYGEVVEYFGHPSDPYVPNTGKKNKAEKKCVICPACDTINFLPRRECVSCSYEFLQSDIKPKQVTKSLTATAAEVNLNANGFPEYDLAVLKCVVDNDYVAKSGSSCVKLTYTTMQGEMKEFIKKNTSWHRQFNSEVLLHKKTPTKIKVEKRGKFFEVIKRLYV